MSQKSEEEKKIRRHNVKFMFLWSLVFSVVIAFAYNIVFGFASFLAINVYSIFLDPIFTERKKQRTENAYKKYLSELPDANDHQLEEAVRHYLWKKQLIKAVILFFAGALVWICFPLVFVVWLKLPLPFMLVRVIQLIGFAIQLLGVFVFVRASHDPLTPAEMEELKEKDRIEKTGR